MKSTTIRGGSNPGSFFRQVIGSWTEAGHDYRKVCQRLVKLVTIEFKADAGVMRVTLPWGEESEHKYLNSNSVLKPIELERYRASLADQAGIEADFQDGIHQSGSSVQCVLSARLLFDKTDADNRYSVQLGTVHLLYRRKMSWDLCDYSRADFRLIIDLFGSVLSSISSRMLLRPHNYPPEYCLTEVFRLRVEAIAHCCKQSNVCLGLVTLPLNRLDNRSGSSYLVQREKALSQIAQYMHHTYPADVLMTIDERNNLELMLLGHDHGEITTRVEALCTRLRQQGQLKRYFQSCRAGLALYPDHGRTVAELVRNSRVAASWGNKQNDPSWYCLYDANLMDSWFSGEASEFWTDSNPLNFRNTGILIQAIEAARHLPDLAEVEAVIVDKAIELTGAERGLLLLTDEAGQLHFKRGRWAGKKTVTVEPFISQSIPAQVLESGKSLCYVTMDPNGLAKPGQSILELQLLSVMCTPLVVKGSIIGVLYVDSKKNKNEFVEADLTFFQALGHQMGIILEVARLFEENRENQVKIEALNEQLQEKLQTQEVHLLDVEKELALSHSQLQRRYRYDNLVGSSPKMMHLFSLLDRIAPYDYPVLIEGESGTGKELVARAIHFNSLRKDCRFVSENCGAIPDTLFEAELFGHTKGAFTGALHDKKGLVQQAEGGTLFLDEIANMSDALQKGILRVIHEKEVRPVGAKHTEKVNIRLICSSNQPLNELVRDNKFREDLFYRLNVIRIQLPPLRDRKEDIPLLVDHFLKKVAQETGGGPKRVHPDALTFLCDYDWPGNVRELENEIRRLYIFSDDVITTDMISAEIGLKKTGLAYHSDHAHSPLSIQEHERELIRAALEKTQGSKAKAARLLGISRTNLYQKMKKYDLKEKT
ncbi:sigma-54-dependent Fis family transcriptional regulator [bacterium]|nr:sigma-54-dependent Fis family transcriptional regulator [bacterium]